MENNPICVEQFPEQQILCEDDHRLKTTSYFQIHSTNFEFTQYDYGTQELKDRYHITKDLFRYFNKRKFLFSKFQMGINIDRESWYSVIPEAVSHYLCKRFKDAGVKKIFEPFSGVGGIAIHLCDHFQEYIVNDIDENKLEMLRNNMKVYSKSINKLKFFNSDFLKIQPFKTDALIICPPWGGISTEQYAKEDLDQIMFPKLSDILNHAKQFSNEILLQLPKQTNIENMIRVFHRVEMCPIFTVEKIMTNDKCSQLFVYLGKQNFTKIGRSQFYNHLYRDLNKEDKKGKKEIKNQLSEDFSSVLNQVYKSRFPNKITYFD